VPCGVPNQQWPYACGIDANNGLRFDPATGRLWTRPHGGLQTYSAAATLSVNTGRHQLVDTGGTTWLRVWWAGAYTHYGQLTEFALSTTATVTHTNDTCLPQRALVVTRVPQVRWNNTWQTNRNSVGALGYINGAAALSSSWLPHSGTQEAADPIGDPFNAGFPSWARIFSRAGVFTQSGRSLNYDAEVKGLEQVATPPYAALLHGGWRTVNPGETVTFGYRLQARTSQNSGINPNDLPDDPWLASFADVRDAGQINVLVGTAL